MVLREKRETTAETKCALATARRGSDKNIFFIKSTTNAVFTRKFMAK